MADREALPSLFNYSSFTKKDPFLFVEQPDVPLTKSDVTCITDVDLNNLDNLDIFDTNFDNSLFENAYIIEEEIVSSNEEYREDSLISTIKTEPIAEDDAETDSGRGSFSEAEMETEDEEEEEEMKKPEELKESEESDEYESEEEETDEDEEEESERALLLDHLNMFAAQSDLDERSRKRFLCDFSSVDVDFILNCHPADLWKLNCEIGLQFRDYLSNVWPKDLPKCFSQPNTAPRPVPTKRQSCRRRKVYVHTFCLDLLLHPKKFSSVMEWTDTKALTFRVLDTQEVAHLWCLVKGNRIEDYETFGRGVRFSMARGFFARMRPQKKKTYRLTEKALRSYNSYRPGIVPSFRR